MTAGPLLKKRWFRLYTIHEVFLVNALAMLFGDWISGYLFAGMFGQPPETAFYDRIGDVFTGVSALILSGLVLWYEIPVRKCLRAFFRGEVPEPAVLAEGRRRVLNMPYFIVWIDGGVWIAGIFLFWLLGSSTVILIGLGTGLLTVTLAFLWIEHSFQHTRIPLFFPEGDMSRVKGGKTRSVRERIMVLVFATAMVPLVFILMTIYKFRQLRMTDETGLLTMVQHLEMAIITEISIFLVVAGMLTFLVTHHLKPPLEELIRVMGNVKKGDFVQKARVYTNDEIGLAAETLNEMNKGLEEREMIKDTFGQFVDRRIRDEILSGRVTLDGERKEVTILFSDLRGFTPLVAKTPPRQLIYMLNAYLDEMAGAIDKNGGLILQFIGDEIEAVFGAPVAGDGHEEAAVAAALDMRSHLARLNQRFAARGIPAMSHGIGIHTGPVLAAKIGSAERAAYSLVGDTVNLASRIQELNKKFQTDILVSDKVAGMLGPEYRPVPMPESRVKGKDGPVRVFTL